MKNSSVRLSPSVETKRLVRVAKRHPQGINCLGDRGCITRQVLEFLRLITSISFFLPLNSFFQTLTSIT
jgi:hypothetical protein